MRASLLFFFFVIVVVVVAVAEPQGIPGGGEHGVYDTGPAGIPSAPERGVYDTGPDGPPGTTGIGFSDAKASARDAQTKTDDAVWALVFTVGTCPASVVFIAAFFNWVAHLAGVVLGCILGVL